MTEGVYVVRTLFLLLFCTCVCSVVFFTVGGWECVLGCVFGLCVQVPGHWSCVNAGDYTHLPVIPTHQDTGL